MIDADTADRREAEAALARETRIVALIAARIDEERRHLATHACRSDDARAVIGALEGLVEAIEQGEHLRGREP